MNNGLRLPPAQLRETMSRLACFKAWDSGVLARLAMHASQYMVQKNSPLLAKGDIPEHLYVLISGQVRLYVPLANGVERTISLINPGETFCESTLLADNDSPYGVAACSDSHVMVIHGPAYLAELRATAELMSSTLTRLAKKFQSIVRDLELCSQHSSLERVVGYLLSLEHPGSGPSFEVVLPGRKRDIASKLSLTQETFSRALSLLVHEGIIGVKGAHIRIEDEPRMRQLASEACEKRGVTSGQFDRGQVASRVFA